MNPTPVEIRIRRKGGSFRMQLGSATSKAQLAALTAQRDALDRLATRGEWDVLAAVKDRRVTPAELVRLIDQYGIRDYRARLDLVQSGKVPTLDEHSARWLDSIPRKRKGKGTRGVYRREIARLADAAPDGTRLGGLAWHEIHDHHILDVRSDMVAKGLAPNTIRTTLGAWGAFFTWAINRDASEAAAEKRPPLRKTSPVRRAKAWGSPETTRHRFLSRAEFHRLLEVSPPPMRAVYATLTLCGLRVDELMSLPPDHVHLPTHIHVGPWGDWAPKGYPRYKHGVGDVPIHRGTLLPLLEEYEREWAGERTFFVNPMSGEPWTYATLCYRLRKDVRAAGMSYGQRIGGKRQPDGVTPHVFRHTLGSWLAQQDVQLVKIAEILRDTVETVRRHYVHLLPGDKDRTIQRLEVG